MWQSELHMPQSLHMMAVSLKQGGNSHIVGWLSRWPPADVSLPSLAAMRTAWQSRLLEVIRQEKFLLGELDVLVNSVWADLWATFPNPHQFLDLAWQQG
jgi:hypothetical protein